MILFDIGSNVGMWALSNYNENTQIIAVEASPSVFKILEKNVAGKRITPLNFAVTSSTDETVDFFECSANTLSTLNQKWLSDPLSRFYNHCSYRKIRTNTITIDKLVETYGIPDLIKIDVEGAEDIVLQSLTTSAKTICFEWAAEMYTQIVISINHLETLGYSKFHIQNEDKYNYVPASFELNKEELLRIIDTKVPKVDWGMIWTTI